MSIRANVGALQLYLNRIRLDPTLTRLREDLEHGVSKIPAIGRQAYRFGKDVKESMKALLVPGMLFEELGFAYIGVVDGHDLHALRESIRQAIDTRRPVVVHVRTVKGKGYKPAEAKPDAYPRHRAVPPHERRAQGRGRGDDVHGGLRTGAGAPGREGPAGGRHHRRHDPGHRAGGVRAALPGPLLRRRHRRGARRRLRRRPGHRRHASRGRRVLHLPAARLRHARAGRRSAAAARGLRRGPRRPGRRRRAHAPRRVRPQLPARHPRTSP